MLANASRINVWLPWYFKQRLLTVLTVPIFLMLVYCMAVSVVGSAVHGYALLRASRAVFGLWGVIFVVVIGWLPVLLPPVLYYSLAKNLPGLWLRPDAPIREKLLASLAVIVLLPLAAWLIYIGMTYGIGWIADRDPCAALAAGVTGSKPCP